jgi:hypothetical protein
VKVPSVNATCVDPEVLELVLGCLFSAELQLSITVILLFVSSSSYVLKENLGIAPSVRKDSIGRNNLAPKVCHDKFLMLIKAEKSHTGSLCIVPGWVWTSKERKQL